MNDRPEPHPHEPGLWPDAPCARCGLEESSTVHVAPEPFRLVRRTDPETSRKGARSVTYRAGTQKALLLLAYLRADRPLADAKAAALAGLLDRPGCCWWHRCSDLRADGMIEPVGTAPSPITGEDVMICALTDLGRQRAHGLEAA